MPLSTSICICICVPGKPVVSVTGPALGSNALTTFPRPCLGTVEDAADMIPSKGSGPMSSSLGMNEDKGSLES